MPRSRTGSAFLYRGAWHFAITLRPVLVDGKPKRSRKTYRVPERADGRPITETYARQVAEDAQHAYDTGALDPTRGIAPAPPPEAKTVLEALRAWIKTQTHATADQESQRIEYYFAKDPIGAMPIDIVRPKHVVEFIERMRARPSRRDGTLAARTVRNIHSILQRMYARAVLTEAVDMSPCAGTADALPKIVDKTPGARATWVFKPADVEALISDPRVPHDRRVLWALLFFTGARFGEIAALKWSDYDRTAKPLGRLTLARSIESRTGIEGSTKTEAIKRVPVHPALAAILAEWKLTGFAAKVGRAAKADDRIVPNERGDFRGENSDNEALGRDCTKLGIDVRNLHCTRHTFLSVAADVGARREIIRWVTHAPPKDTMGGYTHPAWATLCDEIRLIPFERRRARRRANG